MHLFIGRDLATATSHLVPDPCRPGRTRIRYYIERCASWYHKTIKVPFDLAQQAVAFWTSRRLAQIVHRDLLDAAEIPVRKLGEPDEETGESKRHGKHLLFTPEAIADIQFVVEQLERHGVEIPEAWTRSDRTLDASRERVLIVSNNGQSKVALCPIHDDHTPSLRLNPTGSAVCYACGSAEGRKGKYVGQWRTTDGDWNDPSSRGPLSAGDQVRFRPLRGLTAGTRAGPGADLPSTTPAGFATVTPGSYDLLSDGCLATAQTCADPCGHPASTHHDGVEIPWSSPVGSAPTKTHNSWSAVRGTLKGPPIRAFGVHRVDVYRNAPTRESYDKRLDHFEIIAAEDRVSQVKQKRLQALAAFERAVQARAQTVRRGLRGEEEAVGDLPDRLMDVTYMKHASEFAARFPVPGSHGCLKYMRYPRQFKAVATTLIVFDFDDVAMPADIVEGTYCDEEDTWTTMMGGRDRKGRHRSAGDRSLFTVGTAFREFITADSRLSKLFTGRLSVIRTSETGFHVVVELRRTRRDSDALWKNKSFRAVYAALGRWILESAHANGCEGGHHDQGACVRTRLPSWRIKGHGLFRARLIMSSASQKMAGCSEPV